MGYRQLPTMSRRLGYEISPPSELELQPGEVTRCRERSGDALLGELELRVFQAALVIDRDGLLEEQVTRELERIAAQEPSARVAGAMPFHLPGASGFRGSLDIAPRAGAAKCALPYVYVFAVAPHDMAIDGGVLVTVRSAGPAWPAADATLQSMKILSRRGTTANDAGDAPLLPLIGQVDED